MAKKTTAGRTKSGQFKKGSPAAKRAGRRGGLATAKKNASCHRKRTTKAKASKGRQRSLRLG
ncbi:hypothetical protein [Kordiimonas sp.]|uniref:hypothetical protein n=1 Tax=Kordiimonas sp. TaxID=1970157 RepID=UPI003A8FDA94